MHRVNGTGNSPSPGQPTPGVVQQDKSSGGSVDTTKTRSGPQRVRMSSGERPMGAAKGKQSDTEALCQNPPHPRVGEGPTESAKFGEFAKHQSFGCSTDLRSAMQNGTIPPQPNTAS